jgi:carbon storage regulator
MLVLTRKLGEVVKVGNDVEVFVVGVSSGRVKLGFRAPRGIVIQRAEVAAREETLASDMVSNHAEGELVASHSVSARVERTEFSTSPPLRLFRQLGPA